MDGTDSLVAEENVENFASLFTIGSEAFHEGEEQLTAESGTCERRGRMSEATSMRRERSGNIISRSGMSPLNPTIRGSMRTTASTDLKNFARIRTILSCRTVIAVLSEVGRVEEEGFDF